MKFDIDRIKKNLASRADKKRKELEALVEKIEKSQKMLNQEYGFSRSVGLENMRSVYYGLQNEVKEIERKLDEIKDI